MRHDGPEYTLIANALTGRPSVANSEWNWDRTIAIASREEVLPSLHGKLNCPPDVADFLEAVHELNSARNRQLLVDLEELALLLNRAGIVPVLLKGAAYLVAGVYNDPGSRLLCDIDLLVPVEQGSSAYELLLEAGYEPHIDSASSLVVHHFPILLKVGHLPVEIHHTVGLRGCDSILSAREVLDRASVIPLGRAMVRLPSAEHLMTHLIMHSQLHHGCYYRIWPPLKAMLDLVRLNRRRPPDWDAVRRCFAKQRKAGILHAHLLQVANTLGFTPPFPLFGGMRWLHRRILWRETRLKHIDPLYSIWHVLSKRVAVSLLLIKHPLGRKRFLMTPFRLGFYRKLWRDLK